MYECDTYYLALCCFPAFYHRGYIWLEKRTKCAPVSLGSRPNEGGCVGRAGLSGRAREARSTREGGRGFPGEAALWRRRGRGYFDRV